MRKLILGLVTAAIMMSFVALPSLAEGETFTRDGYTYEYMRNGGLKLLECSLKDDDTINIPDQIDGHHVESIAEYAFDGCRMSKVTIPEAVQVIYSYSFNNCTNIERIRIPNNVFFIDGNPFTGCTNLVNIDVDYSHETLAVYDGVLYSKRNSSLLCYPCAFSEMSYKVENGILNIGKGAFYGCNNLVSVTLPPTVKEIESSAFMGCSNLVSITLPDSLLTMGDLAFAGCTMLGRVRIPTNVSRIERSTFFNCISMTSADFPENLTLINDRAFYGCKKLKEVKLHDNVKTIGSEAFFGCEQLQDAYVPVSVTKIGDAAFDNCSARLHLHITEHSFADIYRKIYDISVTTGKENAFLNANY